MDWRRGHTIGRGSSATVSIATCCHSNDNFAVKSVELSQSEMLQREQSFLCNLSSPHIVSYKGYDITRENDKLMYNLKLEYIADGTLIDAVRKNGGRLEESMISCYTLQILQGLEYLHSSGVAHCDIKGANILIGENGSKLADLGCAKWINLEVAATNIGGTPMFMAPEVARGEEQGCPADMWALGCTIIEMATGGSPWPNNSHDPMSILYQIACSGKSPDIPEFLSQQARDFLSKCLMRDPNDRWTVTQLLKHPFLENLSLGRKQNQELVTSSPTSVLDQGVWNSIEEESDTHTRCLNSSEDERIGRLSMNSRLPNWTWEEAWITIRKNNDEEEDRGEWVNDSYGW